MSGEKIYELDLSSKYCVALQLYSNKTAKCMYWKGYNSNVVFATDYGNIDEGFPVGARLQLSREEFLAVVNGLGACVRGKKNQQSFFRVLLTTTKKWKNIRQGLICRSTGDGGYCLIRQEAKHMAVNENEKVSDNPVPVSNDDGIMWEDGFEKFFISATDNVMQMVKKMCEWLHQHHSVIFPDDTLDYHQYLKTSAAAAAGTATTTKKRKAAAAATDNKTSKKQKKKSGKRPQIEVDALVVLFEFFSFKNCDTFEETCMRYSEEMCLDLCEIYEHKEKRIDYICDIYKKIGENGLRCLYNSYKKKKHSMLQSDPEATDDGNDNEDDDDDEQEEEQESSPILIS